jgi:uncharacterized OB-fold protein
LTQEAATAAEKKPNPIVPFLKLPEDYPKQEGYLWGVVCKSCGAKYLGARTACGNCGSTGPFEETRFGDEGEIYSFAVVHQTVPGLEAPYVAAIIDLDDGVSVRANVYGLDIGKPVRQAREAVHGEGPSRPRRQRHHRSQVQGNRRKVGARKSSPFLRSAEGRTK